MNTAQAPALPLYGYQSRWVQDESRFKIAMFARQCGKTFTSTLELALVWKENDRAMARDQRTRLPTLVAQLLMRNPRPGGVDAWLESWSPDRGGLHPVQVWRATVRGEYITPRETP